MKHVEYKVTVLGSCGKEHLSVQEWATCPSCKAIDDRNRK